jgi:hypothetical protein
MNFIDDKLIWNINRGRCFLFIGSGPSCELGYPSWKKLTEDTFFSLKDQCDIEIDKTSFEKYLALNKYPEIFQLFQDAIGDRNKLLPEFLN